MLQRVTSQATYTPFAFVHDVTYFIASCHLEYIYHAGDSRSFFHQFIIQQSQPNNHTPHQKTTSSTTNLEPSYTTKPPNKPSPTKPTKHTTTMGAVVSCIQSCVRTIGRTIMAVINGIGGIIMAIVNGIVNFLSIVVGCLTCNTCGGRRRHGAGHTTGRHRGFGRRRHVGGTRAI
ncbi:hypothetical protein B0I37DRAFT_49974 [Chaetomium sp. MPI-CAGE-AT-0009]|nr:hypothetical protein B0I37DRAFT_49974 [Chaetomium sp. MPI-CAGE-AT-0009]